MGIMKRILENQMVSGKSAGFQFTNADPEITIKGKGVYSGISGARMLQSKMNVETFNADVKKWGRKVAVQLRRVASEEFPHGKTKIREYKSGLHAGTKEKKLARSIRARYRKERGGEQIDTIGFGLERHGVFLQKGVGRGYVSNGSGVSRVAESEPKKYRFKKDWFNHTLDNNIKQLSEIIVHHAGDALVLNTKRMFIQ